jgi:hypothetical protein
MSAVKSHIHPNCNAQKYAFIPNGFAGSRSVSPYRADSGSSDRLFDVNFLEYSDLNPLQLRIDTHEIP